MQQSSRKLFDWKWAVLLIVIAAELYTMYRFWQSFNSLILLALILGSIVVGLILMRWEGSICWKRILYMERNHIPSTNEMRDGVLILFAGILMVIPGLVTDVMGLLLFLPPIRWIVSKLFLRNLYFEIPEGMEARFRKYASQNEPQRAEENNSSEQFQSDEFKHDNNEPFDSNQDIQIIDVEATAPQKTPNASERQIREDDS